MHLPRAIALAYVIIASGCTPVAPPPSPTGVPFPTASPEPSATSPAPVSTATQVVPCASPGRIETGAYIGVVLEQSLAYRIYLPPCYSPASGPYPTLYALHGKPFDDSHWDALGLDEAAEAEIVAGSSIPFLIVMPNVPEPLFSSTDGGPGSYEQEFIEGLLPYIESTYAADPRATSRALAGISRGGVWALEIGLRHSEAFDALAALSPALAVNRPGPGYDPFEIAATPGPFPGHIFLAAGETDWARAGTERLAAILEQSGWSPEVRIVPGGHEAHVWEASIGPMLQAIGSGWSSLN